MQSAHLAIDLGASSGRAILGILDGDPLRLELREVHRFEHHACLVPTGIVWNLTGLWRQILHGLAAGAEQCRNLGVDLASIGVDCWGVDFVLVGAGGEVLGLPHCYRDPRNLAASERVKKAAGGYQALYSRTGIADLPFNTINQLQAVRDAEPRQLEAAERLLFLPDLFHYWLSGQMSNELSIASTGAALNVETGDWDHELLSRITGREGLVGELVNPGTQVGTLRDALAEETSAPRGLKVIAPASHDTASAVAASPVVDSSAQDWAYLSSGTWSLLGAELDAPRATAEAASVPFTHERGVDGSIRFLKNIAGLWLVQELRREYRLGGQEHSFAELAELAEQSEAFRTIINPNHPSLAAPGAMTTRIAELARQSGQPHPESPGQFVRCCLESLALCYDETARQLSSITGRPINRLHIVGGGSQNQFLNRLTAGAVGCEVLAGPTEATAIGNALVQAIGCGMLGGLEELRAVVARSFATQSCEPLGERSQWDAARARYAGVVSG